VQIQGRGNVQLTAENRSEIRRQVLARRDVPRVDHADFALNIGTTVPAHVRFAPVPMVLVTMYPEFRDHEFFVVDDDIFIVDNSHVIIGVVPAGEQVGMAPAPRGMAAGPLNLSVDEIREVQIALKSQGFDVVVDGQMGPRTMAALTQFQRRQGLQATGKIDSQTVAALGVNVKGAQGQPSTTGRSDGKMGTSPRPQAPAGTPSEPPR
jgi:hypothetical protein